jgi:hypothetical protein
MLMIIKVVVYEIFKYLSFVCESKGVWEVEHPFIHSKHGWNLEGHFLRPFSTLLHTLSTSFSISPRLEH